MACHLRGPALARTAGHAVRGTARGLCHKSPLRGKPVPAEALVLAVAASGRGQVDGLGQDRSRPGREHWFRPCQQA